MAALGWVLGNLTSTAVVEQFSLILFLIGFVWGVLGAEIARCLLFPLAFLFFAVPFGEGLIPWLQDFSAWLSVRLLSLSGIPVLLEGRYINVPHGKWEVAEVCSGVRYLISSLAVGFVFAGLVYRSWARRIGFFAASAIIPILANALRIYGVVLLGYLGSERLALDVDHRIAGLVFFSAIMILLFLVGIRWSEDGARTPALHPEDRQTYQRSESQALTSPSYFSFSTIILMLAFLFLTALAPLSARLLWNRLRKPADTPMVPLALMVSSPWSASQNSGFLWRPQFLSPTSELTQTYESGAETVKLYVAYFRNDQQGGKLVSSVNQLYDRPHWMRVGEGHRLALISNQPVEMHEVFAQSDDSALRIWSCYFIDNKFTSNDYRAKLLLAKARLWGSRQGAAAIVVAAEDLPPRTQGEAILRDFLSHVSTKEGLLTTH